MKHSIPILQELDRLKKVTEKQPKKIQFQPSPEEQIDLIIKNASLRMVSAAIKKQSAKCLFHERMNKRSEDAHGHVSGSDTQEADFNDQNAVATVNDHRAQTAPTGTAGNSSTKLSPSPAARSSVGVVQRPKTTGAMKSRQGLPKSVKFTELLKSSVVNEEFQSELAMQIDHQAKDVRKVFDALCTKMKQGAMVQFSPKLSTVHVDVSGFDPPPVRAITKIEDISNMKKKEGNIIIEVVSRY